MAHNMAMRLITVLTSLTILMVTACAHQKIVEELPPPPLNLRPPDFEISTQQDRATIDQVLMQLGLTHTEKNIQWYVGYRRAQLWITEKPQLSCELFGPLSQEKLFPLQDIARLHAFETCDKAQLEKFHLGTLAVQAVETPVQDFAREIALKRTAMDANLPERLKLLLQKSRTNLSLEDRLRVVNEALGLARTLGDTQSETEALKRLYRLAPRLNPAPADTDLVNVAQDYRRHRDFTRAIEIYERLLKQKSLNFIERVAAYRGLRQTYKLSRDKAAYLKTSQELSTFLAKNFRRYKGQPLFIKVYHDVTLDVVRSQWTSGHYKEAKTLLADAEKKLKNRTNLAELYLIQGRMSEERKDAKAALAYFELALAEKNTPNGKSRLQWFVAWNQRKLGMLAEAVNSFDQMRSQAEDPFAKNRGTFWMAKTLLAIGDKARAEVELKQLIQDDQLGYYGLLAHRELKIPIPSRGLKRAQATPETYAAKSTLKNIYDVNQLNWLLSVEERDLGKSYLDYAAERLRSNAASAMLDQWQELFAQYVRAEAYPALNDQLLRIPTELRVEILDRHPEFLFPTPFNDIVKKASDMFDVSEELIYAIMRQESSFNPKARSMADAFGLMQVLPELAERTKAQAKVAFTQTDDLLVPDVNIPIGTAYLHQLMNHYNGQFVLVVASYNAAEDAIQTWVNTRWRGDTLEFIEDIPYEETRGYIRLVMRNLIFYSLLKAPSSGLEFPEWVLELKPLST